MSDSPPWVTEYICQTVFVEILICTDRTYLLAVPPPFWSVFVQPLSFNKLSWVWHLLTFKKNVYQSLCNQSNNVVEWQTTDLMFLRIILWNISHVIFTQERNNGYYFISSFLNIICWWGCWHFSRDIQLYPQSFIIYVVVKWLLKTYFTLLLF